MDNNFNTQQPQMGQQTNVDYTQQPQMQQMNAGYTQQPQMQQMNMGYTQQPQMQQMYGQQYGYNQQYGYTQQSSKLVTNAKQVQADFKNKVSRMGLSTFCLVGIIAAMLLIFGPFINFASFGYNEKIGGVKVKVSDGFNMFELSKLSGSVDRVIKNLDDLYEEFYGGYDDYYYDYYDYDDFDDFQLKIDKDDITDELKKIESDDIEDLVDILEDESDGTVEVKASTIKAAFGTVYLVLKGTLSLLLTPWLIIISGIGLLVFTVINNKKMKLVCSIIPLACLLWIMLCSKFFFSMIGMGAWVIIIGSIAGIVSAMKDQ